MSQGQLTTYAEDHLLCGAEASRYFQTIDQSAFAQLQGTDTPDPDRSLNYVVTTLLIEERANRIYPFYEELLSRVGFSGYLKAIVREETGHLQDITTQILENESLTPELLNTLRQSEDEAFTQFTQSLEQELERQLTIAS